MFSRFDTNRRVTDRRTDVIPCRYHSPRYAVRCRAVHRYTGRVEQMKKLARRQNEDGQQSTAKDKKSSASAASKNNNNNNNKRPSRDILSC